MFVNIVDLNSFSAAAWKMNIAPSTLSKMIAKLEIELGYKLFDRTTKKITLTLQGQNYYPFAKEIVAKFKESKQINNNNSPEISGLIRIATPSYFSYLHLIEPLQKFLSMYPKIQIRFLQYNSPALVSNDDADIAFTNYKIVDSKTNQELILSEKRLLMAAPKYLKTKGIPNHIADLSKHDCLVNGLLYPEGMWQFGKDKVKINARVFTTDALYIIQAAIAGMGIMWTPPFFVKNYLETNQLKILDFPYAKTTFNLYLAYPTVSRHDKIRLLIQFLKENLGLPRAAGLN